MNRYLRCSASARTLLSFRSRHHLLAACTPKSKLLSPLRPRQCFFARFLASTNSGQSAAQIQRSCFTVDVPENVPFVDFIYSKFDEYKDNVAIVSTCNIWTEAISVLKANCLLNVSPECCLLLDKHNWLRTSEGCLFSLLVFKYNALKHLLSE